MFAQIALQVRVDYVIGLFGEPTYRQCHEGWRFKVSDDADEPTQEVVTFTERIWLLADDGYLQVLTDEQDNVVRYSLTTRSRKFHPRVPIGAVSGNLPRFAVRLGRTRFSEIPPEPDRIYRGPYGATAPYEYRQSYYFGRSGGYADWTCVYNAVGSIPVDPLPPMVPVPPWEHALSGRGWLVALNDEQRSRLNLSRAGTVVNTVTIEHSDSDRSGKIGYGPDRELVRLMPACRRRRRLKIRLPLTLQAFAEEIPAGSIRRPSLSLQWGTDIEPERLAVVIGVAGNVRAATADDFNRQGMRVLRSSRDGATQGR